VDVVRVVEHPVTLGGEVVDQWVTGDPESLSRSLRTMASYDAVVLQHEYGLFGGADGEDVLDLVDGLDVALVPVVHTVLLEPSPNQRRVLDRIMEASAVVVVQSRAARARLVAVHGHDRARVLVVPHGAAPNFSPLHRSPGVRPMVLTWGLLGPGKGIEHGIGAVAALRDRGFDATYVVAGQTHPKVQVAAGEGYRAGLVELARELGVEDRVWFDDAYRDWESLRALVRSADVVLLPYDSADQVSSGVLVEALASARPVVATRFPHAEELLARGAGTTVPHRDVDAMAGALGRVLFEPGVAPEMATIARRDAASLLWPAVGTSYRLLVDRVVRARSSG
jgi:glycosyltransferase involved in cell wall biosynthesis